jgi:GDPmannose 4,6-dehydratase
MEIINNDEELNKVWLITGVTGQDGSYLCDYLLELGYKNIHGIIRRSSTFNTSNIDHIFDKLQLHYGDLTDNICMFQIINKVRPDYFVNFAAQSHVKVSEELENYTFQVNTIGVLNILQSIRSAGLEKTCRIYHASTSEMYGNETDGDKLLDENTPMHPVSIYGIAKKSGQELCNMYKEAYNMYVVTSVLFNHEGPRRGQTFVTQKIAYYVGNFLLEKTSEPLELGNLNARRDWGYAYDYVKAVYLMLRQKRPNNYVIATNETHSVREFVELAFKEIGIDIEWLGEGIDEIGVNKITKQTLVKVNPKYYRPIDIECLIGDATKARKELGWKPDVDFKSLVSIMVKNAIKKSN